VHQGTEKLPIGVERKELTYPIQATTGGLVPNFADDASPVQTAAFVEATQAPPSSTPEKLSLDVISDTALSSTSRLLFHVP
jgi:hypothetical protein